MYDSIVVVAIAYAHVAHTVLERSKRGEWLVMAKLIIIESTLLWLPEHWQYLMNESGSMFPFSILDAIMQG